MLNKRIFGYRPQLFINNEKFINQHLLYNIELEWDRRLDNPSEILLSLLIPREELKEFNLVAPSYMPQFIHELKVEFLDGIKQNSMQSLKIEETEIPVSIIMKELILISSNAKYDFSIEAFVKTYLYCVE